MKQALFLILVASMAVGVGCRKKPVETPPDSGPTTGALRLAFRNVAGTRNVVLGPTMYATASGDSFSISRLKYFISNIELLDASGNAMKPEPTYNLIDEAGSRIATAENFTPGTYTRVRFMVGVDSARNVSGVQSGDLDPGTIAQGMFWDWNTGYIMALLEGKSPQSTSPANSLTFHMGGFKGPHSVLRTVTLPLPSLVVIRKGKVTELHITHDVREWFMTPNAVEFSRMSFAMEDEPAAMIADNYMDAFTVTEVHNEE